MNKINDGGPAFPRIVYSTQYHGNGTLNFTYAGDGVSLRDYFAAKAMPMLAQEFYGHGQVLAGGTVPQLCRNCAQRSHTILQTLC